MQNFFSGLIVGIIFIQMAIFAPAVLHVLDGAAARKVMNSVAPRFFLLLSSLGVAELAAILVNHGPEPIHYAVGAVSAVLPCICLLLLPLGRQAREQGNAMRGKWLDNVGVTLAVVVLLANIFVPLLVAI